MLKFLLLSILLATFLIPTYAARARDPRTGLWITLGGMALAEVGYALYLFFVYPSLV